MLSGGGEGVKIRIWVSLKLSLLLCGWQNNPYIDDEAEDEDEDEDYVDDAESEDDEDSEKDAHDADDEGNGELSDADAVDGTDAGDNDDVESVQSLHLHLDTEDVEDTQCKMLVMYAGPLVQALKAIA